MSRILGLESLISLEIGDSIWLGGCDVSLGRPEPVERIVLVDSDVPDEWDVLVVQVVPEERLVLVERSDAADTESSMELVSRRLGPLVVRVVASIRLAALLLLPEGGSSNHRDTAHSDGVTASAVVGLEGSLCSTGLSASGPSSDRRGKAGSFVGVRQMIRMEDKLLSRTSGCPLESWLRAMS